VKEFDYGNGSVYLYKIIVWQHICPLWWFNWRSSSWSIVLSSTNLYYQR